MDKAVLEQVKIEKINEYNALIKQAEQLVKDIEEIDDAIEWVIERWDKIAEHSINP